MIKSNGILEIEAWKKDGIKYSGLLRICNNCHDVLSETISTFDGCGSYGFSFSGKHICKEINELKGYEFL